MASDQSNNGTNRTRLFKVGDQVEHKNSHRVGSVQEVHLLRNGTYELRVCVLDDDEWWWSPYAVRNLTAEEEE